MKIIVIGSKGMLGQDIVEELSKKKYNVLGFDITKIDITKEEDMRKIEDNPSDIIINCAAYTNVDLAEKEKEKCYGINVVGIKNLVELCKKKNITLISISTDYIFDGKKQRYDETDKKKPINYYGETKSLGEDIITENLERYYLVRTSWLFGKKGKNFVESIIKNSSEKPEIKVVNDQTGRPTYTRDLCKGIINLIESKKPFGIYHLTNSGICTRYEFAKEIISLKGIACKIIPCKTDEFPRDAKRPKFSVINNNKTEQLRDWHEALKAYLEE